MQPLNQVQQESGKTFLCPHAAQQQHDAVLPHNLAAHDFVNMALQRGHFTRQFFNAIKWHDTDLGVFQRDRVAGVMVVHNTVETDDFTGHLKSCYLIPTVF